MKQAVALLSLVSLFSSGSASAQHPFGSPTQASNLDAQWIDAVDVQGLGLPSILVAAQDGYYWLEYMGTPLNQNPIYQPHLIGIPGTGRANGVHGANINGDLESDGDQINDVLIASAGILGWYPNSGGGAFGSLQVIDSGPSMSGLVWAQACDLNNDGEMDVVSFSSGSQGDEGIHWYRNLGTGGGVTSFAPKELIHPTPADASQWERWRPHINDMDGDSDLDILIVEEWPGDWSWIETDIVTSQNLVFTTHVISSPSPSLAAVHSADVDNDGDADPMFSPGYSLYVFPNNLSFGFGSPMTSNGVLGRSITSSDFDSDGDQDIVVGGQIDPFIGVVSLAYSENLGATSFADYSQIWDYHNAENEWASTINVIAADLNGDHCPDLIANVYAVYLDTGTVLVLKNVQCEPHPHNDDCFQPLDAVVGYNPFILTKASVGQQGQTDTCDPPPTGGVGPTIENDVWHTWRAPTSGVVTVSTCSLTTCDTKIVIYQGEGCPEDGTSIACDDNTCSEQSLVQFDAAASQVYTIQLGTSPGTAPGEGVFSISMEGALPQHPFDECETTIWELSDGFSLLDTRGVSLTSSPATTGEDLSGCGIYNDVFARYTATTTGPVVISTCMGYSGSDTADFDTKLSVFEGPCVSANLLACNDNSCGTGSAVSFHGTAGTTYTVQMGGSGPYEMGTATLHVYQETGTTFCNGSPTNCPCSNACDDSTAAAGCSNSAGTCGALSAFGSLSVTSDSLQLIAQGVVPGLPLLFFQGENPINDYTGIPFGDGLRCVGLNVRRLQITNANELGFATSSVDIVTGGNVSAGDTLFYQCWYRQSSSGGPCSNSHNLTNGLELNWGA
jgi:hypothetical protein